MARHKANPDEKGTESNINAVIHPERQWGHKANPDEKGTESCTAGSGPARAHRHKANPDEKGTERSMRKARCGSTTAVTKPIPMKRELKELAGKLCQVMKACGHKANPDEKGTERKSPDSCEK